MENGRRRIDIKKGAVSREVVYTIKLTASTAEVGQINEVKKDTLQEMDEQDGRIVEYCKTRCALLVIYFEICSLPSFSK